MPLKSEISNRFGPRPDRPAPPVILVVWLASGEYRVGPGVQMSHLDPPAVFAPGFRVTRTRSRMAAKQAVTRWKHRTGAKLVIGETLLEGR